MLSVSKMKRFFKNYFFFIIVCLFTSRQNSFGFTLPIFDVNLYFPGIRTFEIRHC